MEKLSRSASGARHLRWAREILATQKAQLDVNKRLTADQKTALDAEIKRIEPRILALSAAVAPYREFVDNAHVAVRAKQRVANFLCDEAQRQADAELRPHRRDIAAIIPGGHTAILAKTPLSRVLRVGHEKTVEFADRAANMIRALPPRISGTTALADLLEGAADLLMGFLVESQGIEALRAPLRAAVQKATYELREELDQMDGRLRSYFSADFIDSLYPELTRKGTVVADEADEEDDTSAPPEGG
jgi:hypothetical protein